MMGKPPLEKEIRRVLREFSFGRSHYIQQKIDVDASTAEIGRACHQMPDVTKHNDKGDFNTWRLKDGGR